jgi:PAS domain S-box-containing protein
MVALALVLSVTFAYWVGLLVLHDNRTLADQRVVVEHLNQLISTLKDAETGQRGYLLTGNERYLEPYQNALAKIPAELSNLRASSAGGDLPSESAGVLENLVQTKLSELKRTIDLRRREGLDAALVVMTAGHGKMVMDQMRSRIDDLKATKEAEIDRICRHSDRMTHLRNMVFALTLAVNLAFLAWAFRRISREISERDAATMEAIRQKDLVSVTLSSIGDAVIVTDADGRVTFMNGVAEQMTGWPAEEAQCKPLPLVFRIINEENRAQVESPVDKVLRLGTIVGLANHTLLLRRDGKEVPIDDSGAPIYAADGSIRGVVLVFRDITERKDDEQQLAKAKDQAEMASRAKSDFLANMSHEIRTPLTAIMGFTDLLLDPAATEEERQRYSATIQRNGKHLTQLIDDILDLSKVEAAKLTTEQIRCHLSAIMADIASILGAQAREKGITLTVVAEGDVPETVLTDPVRLRQILLNIVGNSVKFTSKGGVDVSIRRLETGDSPHGKIEFAVKDTGKGIAPEAQSHLFQAFSQEDMSTSRKYGGTGLGLVLSRRLAEALGGDVLLAKSEPGVGSTFTITISSSVMEGTYQARSHEPLENAEAPWKAVDKTRLRGMRVLVVDDAPDNQILISQVLRANGAEVVLAENGKEAIDRSLESTCDLVLMDLQMPICDGFKATAELRRLKFRGPIIALSAAAMNDDRDRALKAGCNDHISKPIKVRMLVQKVAEYVEAARKILS